MSTQRNSTPLTSRRRNAVAVLGAIIAPIAATIAACSGEPVTGPQAPRSPAMLLGITSPTPKPSARDDANRLTDAQLAAAASTWRTTYGDKETGTDWPLDFTCGSTGAYQISSIVGPNGAVLRVGSNSLTIPQGALASNVQISATFTLGKSVKVDFAPHGLKFAKPVTFVASYAGCTKPSSGTINAYYTNDYGLIEQSMPSANNATAQSLKAITDHFSGYVVAWGRH